MTLIRPTCKRFFRVPSFHVAYSVNVATLLAFVAWLYIDAHFWWVLRAVGTYVGLDNSLSAAAALNRFGPRAILFIALASVGIGTVSIALGRLFVGRRSGRSLSAWMATIALLAGWLSLTFTIDRDTGAEYRVRRDLPRFKSVRAALERNSFRDQLGIETDDGDAIRCVQLPKGERYFFVNHVDPLSAREVIEMGVCLDDGGYLFFLLGHRYTIEHHPADLRPSESLIDLRRIALFSLGDLISIKELGDGWFLTRYEWSFE